MGKFLVKRLLLAVLVLFGASVLIFLIMRVLPGDVALFVLGQGEGSSKVTESQLQHVREALGLNRPLILQYTDWMRSVLTGEMGQSYFRASSVGDMVKQRGFITFEIALLSVVFSWMIGVPLGIVAALKQNSPMDFLSRIIAILGLAVPNFWLGLLFLFFLSNQFHWFPPLIFIQPWDNPWINFQQVWAPSLVLAVALGGYVARMTRSSFLDVTREDFVRTAQSKGLRYSVIVTRHMMKIALVPVITLSSVQLSALLGATVIVETVFALEGLGSMVVHAVLTRDVGVVQSLVLLFATGVVIVNLLVDIVHGWMDPRIRVT